MQGLFFDVNYWWLYIKALINICNQCSGNNVCMCVCNSSLRTETVWARGIELPTHMRDGTQPRSQLLESRKMVPVYSVPKSAKVKQKNTTSQQALASQMPAFSFLPH